jgi:predicted Zn finger-like uncharacterized protein
MIIQCQGCAAKYFLPEDKVPENSLKVRCPKCKAVFTLVPRAETVPAGSPAPPSPALPPEMNMVPPAEVPEAQESMPAPAETPQKRKPAGRGKEDRAKRLARVLVSDILIYNREKRDDALAEGTLMTVLGEEIKKSWELYKEKVGSDVASSTNYFKEALNEILADGQEVF